MPHNEKMAMPFLYRCPTTHLMVQGLMEGEPSTDARGPVAVTCLACGGLHLVDPWAETPPASEEDEP
jgi:hypothetical protein